MDGHGRPVAGRPQQVHVTGREHGGGPGPPGGPAAGGPDGRVEALLAERAVDHRDGHGGAAVVVGRGDQAGRPPEEPGLGLRGDQQWDRPGPVGRPGGGGRGLQGQVDGEPDQLGRKVGGGEGAHAGVLCYGGGKDGRPARAGGSPQQLGEAGRRARGHAQDPFSLGVRRGSRPWVAFRCGMAMGEGAVRGAVCQADRPDPVAFIGSQPSRAAVVAGVARLIRPLRLWFRHLWCLHPPLYGPAGTRQAPDPAGVVSLPLSPGRTERSTTA